MSRSVRRRHRSAETDTGSRRLVRGVQAHRAGRQSAIEPRIRWSWKFAEGQPAPEVYETEPPKGREPALLRLYYLEVEIHANALRLVHAAGWVLHRGRATLTPRTGRWLTTQDCPPELRPYIAQALAASGASTEVGDAGARTPAGAH